MDVHSRTRKSIRKAGISTLFLFPIFLSIPVAHTQEKQQETVAAPESMPFKHGLGFELFQDNCAQCHGTDLEGTDEGPPLLHGYYKPGHHSDMAFVRAIEYGSPQHHWNFGDMKPVEGIDKQQADAIIQFVRWHQRESGLY